MKQKLKYFALFLLSATGLLADQKMLDVPIKVIAASEAYPAQTKLFAMLDERDADIAREALSELLVYVRQVLLEKANEADRDALVVALTNGITPRQIILYGSMLQFERAKMSLANIREDDGQRDFRRRLAGGIAENALERIRRYAIARSGG